MITLEAIAAALVGLAVLYLLLEPLVRPQLAEPIIPEPDEFGETPKGQALSALREIEFDRATGKLSDTDYEQLHRKYSDAALAVLRAEEPAAADPAGGERGVEELIAAKVRALRGEPQPAACPTCGPRPEPDALFCSNCGIRLGAGAGCPRCGAALRLDGRFCEACGSRVAA